MTLRARPLLPRLALAVALALGLGYFTLGTSPPPASSGRPPTPSDTQAPSTSVAVGSTSPTDPGSSNLPLPSSDPSGPAVHTPPPAKPNVVVLLLDDVPYLDPQTPWQATPQIAAALLPHAITFSDFHGETPLCCPGRAGFLTGLHTGHHHVTWNNAALLNPSMTLATALHDAGYYTFLAGKYLNLYDRIAPAKPPGWDGFHATDGQPRYYAYQIWNNGIARPQRYRTREGDYSTSVLTAKSVREIHNAPRDQPVFAWIALNTAHFPLTPAPRYVNAPCSQMPRWKAANVAEQDVSTKPAYVQREPRGPRSIDLTGLCRMMMSVDDAFVALKNELVATGRWNNTIFVLTSDNGMTYGAHRLGIDKRTPYSTQLPFILSWPAGVGTSARTISTRLQNIDFAPTICDLARCTLGPYPAGPAQPDGVSFANLLLGTGRAPIRDAVLSGYPERHTSIPQWDAVTTTRDSALARQGCDVASSGGCVWHYVRYETGEKELYDVSHGPCWSWSNGQAGDPCELHNRAGDPALASIQAALDQRLNQLLSLP